AETLPGRNRADALPRANTSSLAGAHSSEAYEIRTRLVEGLDEARIDVPSLAAAAPYARAYWRQLRGPWEHPTGAGRALLTTLALRTDAQQETPWTVTTQGGQTWSPDARVWNMNEGSFDQRQAIEAPPPATLVFRVKLPPLARFLFSAAVATPSAVATLFDVALVDVANVEHALSQTRLAARDARRWVDEDVDLGAWSGQTVELRLRTSVVRASAAPTRPAAPSSDVEGNDVPRDAGLANAPGASPMSLALWGDPVVVARTHARIPYNVLWIVVDALRPDAAASLHDEEEDARQLAAPEPPLDALLPPIPGLMPSIDRLAARGVRFRHAWSAATWTRPGTLAMLSGERSSELGIDTTAWVLPTQQIARYYASEPPLLPRILCKNGALTAAFVNNFFMAGYAGVGLDMGFQRVTDHRYRTRDTAEITRDASEWLEAHGADRFLLFVNYNSPHEPYDPVKELLARVPPPPAGPRDGQVRAYLAEAAKDDAAIGALLEKLDALNLTRSTLVIVTADHGETLSAAHDAIGLGQMPMRFHHAVGNFEETTRVPLVLALPGVLDGGRAVSARVRNTDIAPTVLELEGLEADPRMTGRSLVSLARGEKEAEPRVIVSEGRASRAILWGPWRMVVHDPPARRAAPAGASAAAHEPKSPDDQEEPETRDTQDPSAGAPDGAGPAGEAPKVFHDELYDLDSDPGERR
ncbi:MAG: sulfatase, partial [Myxococcota bacterium]|nr:sulfatase [Myxococcota bacterium]